MAACHSFVIPTIDVSPYLRDPTSDASAKVVQDVRQACMTTGFFSMVGHGMSKELQERVFKACETLFSLPLEEKQTLISPVAKNKGYELIGSQILQKGTLPDLKEVSNALVLGTLDVVSRQNSRPDAAPGLLHQPAHPEW